jgi:hypothetical protein
VRAAVSAARSASRSNALPAAHPDVIGIGVVVVVVVLVAVTASK